MRIMADEQPPKRSVRDDLFLTVRLAWNLGYLIALPAVAFGFGGAYLDKYAGTSPLFIILGFALAVTLSYLGVKRRIREILKS